MEIEKTLDFSRVLLYTGQSGQSWTLCPRIQECQLSYPPWMNYTTVGKRMQEFGLHT